MLPDAIASFDADALCDFAARSEFGNATATVAIAVLEQLLERSVALGSRRAEAWVRVMVGARYRRDHDLPRAAASLVHALQLFEGTDDSLGEGVSLLRLASVWQRLGDTEAARTALDRGLALARRDQHRLLEGVLLTNLALTWGIEAEAAPYAELSEKALQIFVELGEHARCTHVRCNLAGALARLDRLPEAASHYVVASREVDKESQPLLYALILGGMGEVAYREGNAAKGTKYLVRAKEFLLSRNMVFDALRQCTLLISSQHNAGHFEASLPVIEELMALALGTPYEEAVTTAYRSRGVACRALGRHAEAYAALDEAWERLQCREREHAARRLSALQHTREAVEGELARVRAEELAGVNARLRAALAEREQFAARLEQVALMDALTGVFNRHGLTLAVENLHRTAGPRQPSRGVLVVDVDRFKHINDSYGHAEGDQVLTTVAERLQRALAPSDVLARTGGDEFVAILVDANTEQVQRVAERVRVELASLPIATTAGMLRVTVSVGTATLADLGDLDDAVRLADRAMYVDKKTGGGRNRP